MQQLNFDLEGNKLAKQDVELLRHLAIATGVGKTAKAMINNALTELNRSALQDTVKFTTLTPAGVSGLDPSKSKLRNIDERVDPSVMDAFNRNVMEKFTGKMFIDYRRYQGTLQYAFEPSTQLGNVVLATALERACDILSVRKAKPVECDDFTKIFDILCFTFIPSVKGGTYVRKRGCVVCVGGVIDITYTEIEPEIPFPFSDEVDGSITDYLNFTDLVLRNPSSFEVYTRDRFKDEMDDLDEDYER